MMKSKNHKVRFSIKNKIQMLVLLAAVPFLATAVYLLISMANYSSIYEGVVKNLTVANNYNINFKEEMDESLYKIVVGYVAFEDISKEETLRNPYDLIEELRDGFAELKDITMDLESQMWLDSLLRNLDTLEDRVDDVIESVKEGGHYDRNIKELDNNIYILTELIQDDIQYYIYYQTQSMEEVTSQLNHQVRLFVVVCGVLIAVVGLMIAAGAFLFVSNLLRPVEKLYEATEKISEGDFSVRAEASSHDEIAVLAEGFNNMAGNIQTLFDKVREDEQKMRKADLRLLQEQINPHFLYNTLDTIVWLIEGNEPNQAVDMVVSLSDFFRIVLSRGKEFISIRQEEQHIYSYLQIQEKRYHDILSYSIEIDPALYGYQILKLTLQPLVENALYHGIKYKRSKGTIRVRGTREQDKILFCVEDDGVGMEKEELERIRREIQRPCKETESGFGLANVNERIHMYFGAEYGMGIDSEKGKGTRVTIRIPAIAAESEEGKED